MAATTADLNPRKFIWGFQVTHPAIGALGAAGYGVHVAHDNWMEAISRNGETRYLVSDEPERWALYRILSAGKTITIDDTDTPIFIPKH